MRSPSPSRAAPPPTSPSALIVVLAHLAVVPLGLMGFKLLIGGDTGRLASTYQHGGVFMSVLVLVAMVTTGVGLALSLVHLRKRPLPMWAHLFFPALLVAVAMVAANLGIVDLTRALATIPGEYYWDGMARGLSIALIPLILGLPLAVASCVPVLVLAGTAATSWADDADPRRLASAASGAVVGVLVLAAVGAAVGWALASAGQIDALEAYVVVAPDQRGVAMARGVDRHALGSTITWVAPLALLGLGGAGLWTLRSTLARARKVDLISSAVALAVVVVSLLALRNGGLALLGLNPGGAMPELLEPLLRPLMG
ncbi:tRNA-dihydrouridine synthase A [Plesiocystis pacifica SIR-1]|uniref:tRNA-dihydrouridine synthase A n=1 Tax=Plesiocystis pacifica SIR-1 TaxID=391625 RepID=A6GGZ6_9BACT|nr:hypothetical protein [Plesiocystis pacifica]EDM74881.1 tRNA-dihydrouridine synthase A [Plesiocystis pacifica SIR-1]